MDVSEVPFLRDLEVPEHTDSWWSSKHVAAVLAVDVPRMTRNGQDWDRALITMANGITMYVIKNVSEYGTVSPFEAEYVMDLVRAWRTLLGSNTGRLDGRVCDRWAETMLRLLGAEGGE